MRFFLGYLVLSILPFVAWAQGTPPMDPAQSATLQASDTSGAPPQPGSTPPLQQQITSMVKSKIKQAIDGKTCPPLRSWSPLTTREKLDVFLKHTYSGRTFAGAAIDALKDHVRDNNPEYERGMRGLGQHYGVYLGVNETGVFLEQFLVPSVLKQDPRYFRNPELPVGKRTFYALSRVFMTHADNGHQTFNASYIVGGAMSQALADLYVPGERQGLSPIANRVAFDLVRDAGLNLMHEFWPDLRRKFLHR